MNQSNAEDIDMRFRQRIATLKRRTWWRASLDRALVTEANGILKEGGPDEALHFLRCAIDECSSETLWASLCAICSDLDRKFEAVALVERAYFRNPSPTSDQAAMNVVKRLTPGPNPYSYQKSPLFFLKSMLQQERKLPHVWRHKARVHLDQREWVSANANSEVAPKYDHLNTYTWLDAAYLISQSRYPPNDRRPGFVSGLANITAAACEGAITVDPRNRTVRKRASKILRDIGAYEYAAQAAKGTLVTENDLLAHALSLSRLVIEDNLIG